VIPADHAPDRPAITMARSGERRTYGELDAAANRVSRLLRGAGLAPGDHAAFCVENAPAFLEIAWGAHYAGLLYTAISTSLKVDEVAYIVGDCEARVLFLSARYADKAAALKAATPGVERYIAVGGPIDGYEEYAALVAAEAPQPLEEARIGGRDMLYSSGTTGRPKGIRPAQPALPLGETPIVVTPILRDMFGIGRQDVYLSPAPLYHSAPLRFSMAVHQLGGEVVVMESWDEAECLDLIGRHGVTAAQFVPTMFVRMLRLPEAVRRAADTRTLRLVIHAAAPCPVEVKQQMLDWWGPVIHEYYSATEAAGLTWVTPEDWAARPGTVGRALIGVPHVVDEAGAEVAPGVDGAVFFSDGPPFAYHNDPERTRQSTDAHGWQTFGDIGHLDADGFLYLTDRASYMIISGGVNVYPQEAEDVLQSHPAVMDAAVFGVPDAEMGEAVKAVVEPVAMPADEAAAAALEQELIQHCRSSLAHLKCPRSIDFRAQLPRTPTGKLLKRLLKQEYANPPR
jgi:acyl-CoA synthetase (AMP-forming)/AMP-acid ligase II